MVSSQHLGGAKVRRKKLLLSSKRLNFFSHRNTLSNTDQGVRFKSIGKAAIKGTKQIGKTLTAMSDSPDKRGRGKLAQVNATQFQQQEKRKRKDKGRRSVTVAEESLGLEDGECCLL